MKFSFYGGAREVGRSAILLETGAMRIMLDYGVKLDGETEYPLPFEGLLDAMIISHAHLDHSGYVPHYFAEADVPVYMTPPTLDLSELLWKDMINVARRKGQAPPYTKENVHDAKIHTVVQDYYELTPLSPTVSFEFYDAGHIPGASLTKLYTPEGTVLYSGDFKIESTRLHVGADLSNVEADVLIIESTYADKDHPPRVDLEKQFVEDVKKTLEEGGFVLLPVFAVGRAQEIVDILVSHRVGPIYFDGMARKATKIILRHPEYISNPLRLKKAMRKVHWIKGERDREKALREPAVIVSTAGMLQGGPILTYILNLRNDPRSKIIFTGYQVEDSPGRRVLEEGILEADGYEFRLKTQVQYYDFSAHAGRSELFELARRSNAEYVIVVHGDEPNAVRLAEELREEGFETFAPKLGEHIEIKP